MSTPSIPKPSFEISTRNPEAVKMLADAQYRKRRITIWDGDAGMTATVRQSAFGDAATFYLEIETFDFAAEKRRTKSTQKRRKSRSNK